MFKMCDLKIDEILASNLRLIYYIKGFYMIKIQEKTLDIS